jgi:hypothetical protein
MWGSSGRSGLGVDRKIEVPDIVDTAVDYGGPHPVFDIAIKFVDRMEQHKEELRWDDQTFRLLFELITALRERGFDAAPWWKG